MKTYLFALGSIAISVLAQFTLKSGMGSPALQAMVGRRPDLNLLLAVITQPYVMVGFILYGVGAVVWLAVLSEWDVSKAYPLVGVGFALSAIAGYILGEQITLHRALGILLICSGVWIVAKT